IGGGRRDWRSAVGLDRSFDTRPLGERAGGDEERDRDERAGSLGVSEVHHGTLGRSGGGGGEPRSAARSGLGASAWSKGMPRRRPARWRDRTNRTWSCRTSSA